MALGSYAYVARFFTQTVSPGADIIWDRQGPIVNLVHALNTAPVRIPSVQAGDYYVEFHVVVEGDSGPTAPPQAAAYALFLNNEEIPSFRTRYGATSPNGTNPVKQILTGSAIISVPVLPSGTPSNIRLRNVGNTADFLAGVDDGVGVLVASLTIMRVS